VKNPEVKAYLSVLELDTHETVNLFHLLDNGEGAITAAEFVSGAMRLKGGARSQDVVAIMHEFNILAKEVREIKANLDEMHKQILR